MKLILATICFAVTGCATTGTATMKLSRTVADVARDTVQVHDRVRADLSDLQAIESDGKQIIRLINSK